MKRLLLPVFVVVCLVADTRNRAITAATATAPQVAQPVPYFSITWTATATGVSDTTDNGGTRTVEQRRVVMTGSAIMRLYADGSFDDYPFELSVTDEDDIV